MYSMYIGTFIGPLMLLSGSLTVLTSSFSGWSSSDGTASEVSKTCFLNYSCNVRKLGDFGLWFLLHGLLRRDGDISRSKCQMVAVPTIGACYSLV